MSSSLSSSPSPPSSLPSSLPPSPSAFLDGLKSLSDGTCLNDLLPAKDVLKPPLNSESIQEGSTLRRSLLPQVKFLNDEDCFFYPVKVQNSVLNDASVDEDDNLNKALDSLNDDALSLLTDDVGLIEPPLDCSNRPPQSKRPKHILGDDLRKSLLPKVDFYNGFSSLPSFLQKPKDIESLLPSIDFSVDGYEPQVKNKPSSNLDSNSLKRKRRPR